MEVLVCIHAKVFSENLQICLDIHWESLQKIIQGKKKWNKLGNIIFWIENATHSDLEIPPKSYFPAGEPPPTCSLFLVSHLSYYFLISFLKPRSYMIKSGFLVKSWMKRNLIFIRVFVMKIPEKSFEAKCYCHFQWLIRLVEIPRKSCKDFLNVDRMEMCDIWLM